MAHIVKKSAPPGGVRPVDPHWAEMLRDHAAAASGDPAGMSRWAVHVQRDPAVAALVPEVAKSYRPAGGSSDSDLAFEDFVVKVAGGHAAAKRVLGDLPDRGAAVHPQYSPYSKAAFIEDAIDATLRER